MVTLRATNVAVASVSEDGSARILATWRGDLRPGETISFSELAFVASASFRIIYMSGLPTRNLIETGHAVLFLGPRPAAGEPWQFARSWELSYVFLKDGEVYAPSLCRSYGGVATIGLNETQVRAHVTRRSVLQEELASIAAIESASSRAEALVRLVTSSDGASRRLALGALEACGKDALPVIRRLLAKRSLLALHSELLCIEERIDPESAAFFVEQFLADDARYWKVIAADLGESWWMGAGLAGDAERDYLTARIDRTRCALELARGKADHVIITLEASAVCGLWTSEPSLVPAASLVGIRRWVRRR